MKMYLSFLMLAVLTASMTGCTDDMPERTFPVHVMKAFTSSNSQGDPYFWVITDQGKFQCNSNAWAKMSENRDYTVTTGPDGNIASVQ